MERRIIFYLQCQCGSRGSIVEIWDASLADGTHARSRFTLRMLSTQGGYAGKDELFALLKPACERCGRALAPGSVVAVSERGQVAVIAPSVENRFR